MSSIRLNAEAQRENIRALIAAAGVSEEVAANRLDAVVVITRPEGDQWAARLADEIAPILSRTLHVSDETSSVSNAIAAEVVIGSAIPRTTATPIYVSMTADFVAISRASIAKSECRRVHALKCMIAACYVTGAAIRAAVGDSLPNPPSDPLTIQFNDIVPDDIDLDAVLDIGEAYLAGAGAIGNGFLWAARHVRLAGILHIADDDFVSNGNLQRQIWFDDGDVEEPKAIRLSGKAQPHLPLLELRPRTCRLQDHANRTDGPWLRRLIVAVDSRPARRHLQNELPGEVFDASTSGSREIVLHYNKQPNLNACLGCVYPRDEREVSHEEIVATHLGIEASLLRRERVDEEAAMLISAHHPQLMPGELIGLAFDSLYKQLCGSAQLRTPSGSQVVAPFAFVSVLAGTMLLVEVLRRLNGRIEVTNDWRLNPWAEPVAGLRGVRRRRQECECCGRRAVERANRDFWGAPETTSSALAR